MRLRGIVQTSIRLVYPPTCLTCDTMVETEGGLCGPCWRETPFIDGAVCGGCGAPLVAGPVTDDVLCDDCLRVRRPWAAGRSALVYRDNGRRLVLGLKHGARIGSGVMRQGAEVGEVVRAAALVTDVTAMSKLGLSIGLFFVRSAYLDDSRDPPNPKARRLADLPGVTLLSQERPARSRLAFLHHPMVFARGIEERARLSAARTWTSCTSRPPARG